MTREEMINELFTYSFFSEKEKQEIQTFEDSILTNLINFVRSVEKIENDTYYMKDGTVFSFVKTK